MPIRRLLKVSLFVLLNLKGGGGAAAGGSGGGNKQSETFSKMKEQMGMMGGRPMTKEEAMQILEVGQNESDDEEDELNPHDIMERFDTLIEKN